VRGQRHTPAALTKDSNQIFYSVQYTPTQIHALNIAEATVWYLDRQIKRLH